MQEPVRLVIWDLDETLWRGTLTEGGVEAVPENFEIVRELCRRGIMSSICSKNDLEPVKSILQKEGVWDYFIFPSIDWTPKGPRILQLIETVQLRAASVLFIDDNHQNLQEAQYFSPELQVASHENIANLLGDRRLLGKADPELSRLQQYRLLESRKALEHSFSGRVEDFLRDCDIRVVIDYDVDRNIDRAVELINRTNQLNFTKQRLSEDASESRAHLRQHLARFNVQAGLVRVVDRFGDHGFVGFFLQEAMLSGSRLVHYCWSCRTLGMKVETWLYRLMGRPKITVIGEVLTDLCASAPEINWIRQVAAAESLDSSTPTARLGSVFIRGGCDLEPLAHYFRMVSRDVQLEVNLMRNGLAIRLDNSVMFRYAIEGRRISASATQLGYVPADFDTAVSSFTHDIWILSFWADAAFPLYEAEGMQLPFAPPKLGHQDILAMKDNVVATNLENDVQVNAYSALRQQFVSRGLTSQDLFKENLEIILNHAPPECLIFISLADESPPPGGELFRERHTRLNRWVREVTANWKNVRLLPIRDFIHDQSDVEGLNHFHRMVYYRLYQAIIAMASSDTATDSMAAASSVLGNQGSTM